MTSETMQNMMEDIGRRVLDKDITPERGLRELDEIRPDADAGYLPRLRNELQTTDGDVFEVAAEYFVARHLHDLFTGLEDMLKILKTRS